MTKWTLYCLISDNQPRYVGITSKSVEERRDEHWNGRFTEPNKLKRKWLMSLDGPPDVLNVAEFNSYEAAFTAEKATVRDLELQMFFLVNEQHSLTKGEKQVFIEPLAKVATYAKSRRVLRERVPIRAHIKPHTPKTKPAIDDSFYRKF